MGNEKRFPALLREVMGREGVRPAELAAAVGVKTASVSNWTNLDPDNHKPPSYKNLETIADYLNAPELFEAWSETRSVNRNPIARTIVAGPEAEVLRLVTDKAPQLAQYTERTLHYPGVEPKRLDYASPRLVAEIRKDTGNGASQAASSLWDLAVAAAVDRGAGMGRYHVLMFVGSSRSPEARACPLVAEASLLDVEVVCCSDAQEAADYILSFEEVA